MEFIRMRATKEKTKLLGCLDLFVCLGLAAAFSAALQYLETNTCIINLDYWLTVLVYYAFFLLSLFLARKCLIMWNRGSILHDRSTGSALYRLFAARYSVLLLTCIITGAWLIPLLFLYPGTLVNDTWGMLQQFIDFTSGTGVLSDHHPILDTLIMGTIIVPISQATGQWQLMIFIFVILQASFTGFAFAKTINYTYKKLQLGHRISFIMLLIYCLLPLYPAIVQTVSKDSIHAWIFVLFTLCFTEVVRTEDLVLKERAFILKLTLLL